MTDLTVPTQYPTIAAADNAAQDGDRILLEPGYSNETATLNHNLTVTGDETCLNIVLRLGTGVTTLSLGGAGGWAPFSVIDNTGDTTVNGNYGDNTFTYRGGNDVFNASGGAGDRLIANFAAQTGNNVVGGVTSGNIANGYNFDFYDELTGGTPQVSGSGVEHFTITTGTGNDSFVTGDGNDVISTGTGNDFIDSRGGIDQINGGGGTADRWRANMQNATDPIAIDLRTSSSFLGIGSAVGIEALGDSAANRFTTGSGSDSLVTYTNRNLADYINAGAGNDTVTIGGTTGANVSDQVHGNLGRDRLIIDYSTSTDELSGNLAALGNLPNGFSGSLNNVTQGGAQVVANAGIEDFTISTGSGNDSLVTGDGDDVIATGSGNDFIDSRGGIDQINGGTGTTDRWRANMTNATDPIAIDLRATSTFLGTGSVAGIEALGESAGNRFTTGSGSDTLVTYTNRNLADYINGGAGNDTVTIGGTTGANVADQVAGGYGRDRLIIDYSTSADDLSGNLAALGNLPNGYSGELINVTQGGTQVVANAGIEDFTITTGSGDDALTTGDGNDVINTGNGNDVVNARGGNNLVDGGRGNDVIEAGAGVDTLNGGIGNDSLVGGLGGDSLTGSAGADTLDGGFGADTLEGGTGNDTYMVDNVGDVVTELAGGGSDLVKSTINYTLGTNLEKLTFTGTADLDGTGNVLSNVLTGNGGRNVLLGLGGNDTVVGLSGNDSLDGGSGNDSLNGSTGADTLNGGPGSDTLIGGSANDRLDGAGGSDSLDGGNHDDSLNGGGDSDTLIGGAGSDTLTGGDDADRFVFAPGHDSALITDFKDNVDQIDLTGFGFASVAEAKSYAADVAGDVLFTFAGGEQLIVEGITKAQINGVDLII